MVSIGLKSIFKLETTDADLNLNDESSVQEKFNRRQAASVEVGIKKIQEQLEKVGCNVKLKLQDFEGSEYSAVKESYETGNISENVMYYPTEIRVNEEKMNEIREAIHDINEISLNFDDPQQQMGNGPKVCLSNILL